MLLVTNAYFVDDIDSWMEATKALVVEIEDRKNKNFSAGNRHAPRLLLTGSPPIFS